MSYTPPTKLSIVTPIPGRYERGANAATGDESIRTVRISNPDVELIARAARTLDVTPSYFIRWVAVEAARAMREHRLEKTATDTKKKKKVSAS